MVAVVWLKALIALFVVGLVYVVLGYVYGTFTVGVDSINMTQPEGAQETRDTLDMVWQYWPLIVVFGIILWAFIASQRREAGWEYIGY